MSTFMYRFLYADPMPSALQVYSDRPGAVGLAASGVNGEEGSRKGVWINADPIPGCVVCNIGESECFLAETELRNFMVSFSTVWEVWTNSLYRSTLYQVIHRGSNYRYLILINCGLSDDILNALFTASRKWDYSQCTCGVLILCQHPVLF
jgi:hypothetical protein